MIMQASTALVCYPSPGKKKGMRICKAFAKGCGGVVADVGETSLRSGAAFFYGWTDHSYPLMQQCAEEGRDWYYADNAYYFGKGTYFRVTKNRLMHDGLGRGRDDAKLLEMGVDFLPWRRDGRYVIVVTQSETFYRTRMGIGRDEWAKNVADEIREYTGRAVFICHKPEPPWPNHQPHGNFERILDNAWAVVSYSSSCMVKAVVEGVPVFSLGTSMATIMGLSDLSVIESPVYPSGREEWVSTLLHNQWTLAEIESGLAWRELHRV